MRIAVLGGGAAGFFAAIAAAGSGEASVSLFEAGAVCLQKVRISGGGRCNVTHACFDAAELSRAYPRGGRELRQAFSRFMTSDTVEWFESRGVLLKTEQDGRMFPQTDHSGTIVDCLLESARQAGVEIKVRTKVQSVSRKENDFVLHFSDGASARFNKLIVATGGQPKLEGFRWLEELGHSIVPPVPSLFTFNIPHRPLHDLMGLSAEKAQISLPDLREVAEGALLITHWGLSGPAVLKLSSFAARKLAECGYRFVVEVDWLPETSESETLEWIAQARKSKGSARVRNQMPDSLPRRLWDFIASEAGIAETANWSDLKKEEVKRLAGSLHAQRFTVQGKTTFKEEFVTCGGVSLRDIDFRTMESKKVPGLYFAGEVMDIDAITGGYNFQAAWTTGFIAGESASG